MERKRKKKRKRRKRGGDRRRGKGSGEGERGREVRKEGEKKEKNSHMNRGWAYTELILKEIFKGEKPASCAHLQPLFSVPLTTPSPPWSLKTPVSSVNGMAHFHIQLSGFLIIFKLKEKKMDIYLVTPLLLPLVSECFLLSKTFPVFILSATGQSGIRSRRASPGLYCPPDSLQGHGQSHKSQVGMVFHPFYTFPTNRLREEIFFYFILELNMTFPFIIVVVPSGIYLCVLEIGIRKSRASISQVHCTCIIA